MRDLYYAIGVLVCVNHRHKTIRTTVWNSTLTWCISLVKDKPSLWSSSLSSSLLSHQYKYWYQTVMENEKTSQSTESTFRGEERGKTILTNIFMNSFAHVPEDGLFFWSSVPSSSSWTTEIREPVAVVLDTENRQMFCRLECVQKKNQLM